MNNKLVLLGVVIFIIIIMKIMFGALGVFILKIGIAVVVCSFLFFYISSKFNKN